MERVPNLNFVILLIYEYTIAVEWNLVQSKEHIKRRNDVTGDAPFADRLDRSYFGFDQDYFERMPLLINSLQENSYFDPILEMSRPLSRTRKFNKTNTRATTARPKSYIYNTIRRTSPKPFFFEYRSPTPMPFSKIYGSKSWVESYRNEERLKNIRQVIKYLEKTINAKVADMQTKPTKHQIAFTGVYIEPMLENKAITDSKSSLDLQQQSSNQIKKFEANHQADPLFSFKPENPGDVNLLADDFLRFAPVPAPSLMGSSKFSVPQQNPHHKRHCINCEENSKNILQQTSIETIQTDIPPLSTTKSFSVMLNLFPIRPTVSMKNKKKDMTTTTQSLDKIYLTTSRPKIQFKRKSVPFRRIYPNYKRPRYLSPHKTLGDRNERNKENINNDKVETSTGMNKGTQMIVHVKVYSSEEKTGKINETDIIERIEPITQVNPYTSKAPIEFSTSQIEDHHIGSSGYLPVEIKPNTPPLPKLLPFFESTTETFFTPTLPEVIQFSHEDAKVPDQYTGFQNRNDKHTETSRRDSRNFDSKNEPSTLIIKLRNEIVTTTNIPDTVPVTKANDIGELTTWTYVPQINGHYRNIDQRDDVKVNPQIDRKKRLEMSVSGMRSYVPMYTVIKRNITKNTDDTDD